MSIELSLTCLQRGACELFEYCVPSVDETQLITLRFCCFRISKLSLKYNIIPVWSSMVDRELRRNNRTSYKCNPKCRTASKETLSYDNHSTCFSLIYKNFGFKVGVKDFFPL